MPFKDLFGIRKRFFSNSSSPPIGRNNHTSPKISTPKDEDKEVVVDKKLENEAIQARKQLFYRALKKNNLFPDPREPEPVFRENSGYRFYKKNSQTHFVVVTYRYDQTLIFSMMPQILRGKAMELSSEFTPEIIMLYTGDTEADISYRNETFEEDCQSIKCFIKGRYRDGQPF